MNVLVIAAHPDDEVLGCGGTIARLTQEGHVVHVAILGEGITSRHLERDQADRAEVEALHAHSRQVSELLGCAELQLFNLPDNRFETLPLLELVKIIEEMVARLQPQVIYTHHGGDLNIDHVTVHRAVLTATRPVNGHPVKEVYAFEVPSSTEWAFAQFQPVFRPNCFVAIDATIETKLQAMSLYKSEMRSCPHPRSLESLRAAAKRWGAVAGFEHVEAFELIRSIR